MAFSTNDAFSNKGDSFSSSSGEEMFQKVHIQYQIMFVDVVTSTNTLELFDANELKPSVRQLTN
jgi:hypothetical protein